MQDKGFRSNSAPDFHRISPEKAGAHLAEAIDAFCLSRRVGNCSPRTLEVYTGNLARFQRETGLTLLADVTPLLIQRYLTSLRERLRPTSLHQHFRTLRTFFAWGVSSGLLADHPMRGITMKVPKTLPRVPEDDMVRRMLAACDETFEGRRNKALVALLADSGLWISEALRLRIEDGTSRPGRYRSGDISL